MANEEHVAILKQGVDVWNEWRENNPDIQVDLSNAELKGADLYEINLSEVNLGGAHLSKANLEGASLDSAYLGGTFLNEANLFEADLGMAHLNGAYLQGANLTEVLLSRATIIDAYLTNAKLNNTNLLWVNFTRVDLRGADLTEAKCNHTVFGDTDLSKVKGLETVIHEGPSTIGIDTIYLSGGNIPEVFLRGAGVPDNFITFMKSLTGQAFDFYSCFICHSGKDREFIERLYADLQSNGVRCWYAPEDLKIGEPFLLGIDQGIRLHDKLMLVLSEQSVNSGWVQHEVLSALAKEQGKEPWVLFPIRLDDAVMETTVPWANMIRQSRHIGDFTRWKDHDSYKKAFDRLLQDLKGKS